MSTKIHHLVDGHGLPLVVAVAPGHAHDAPALLPLLAQLTGDPADRPAEDPSDQIAHRQRRGSRGGRPPGFDAQDYRNRNLIERRFCHLREWRGLATRYDKLALVYRAAVLNAVIAWTRRL